MVARNKKWNPGPELRNIPKILGHDKDAMKKLLEEIDLTAIADGKPERADVVKARLNDWVVDSTLYAEQHGVKDLDSPAGARAFGFDEPDGEEA